MIQSGKIEVNLEQVETLLRRRLCGRVRELHLEVAEAGLLLYGHADTYYAKQLAQHAAMEVSGLPILSNQIEVR